MGFQSCSGIPDIGGVPDRDGRVPDGDDGVPVMDVGVPDRNGGVPHRDSLFLDKIWGIISSS